MSIEHSPQVSSLKDFAMKNTEISEERSSNDHEIKAEPDTILPAASLGAGGENEGQAETTNTPPNGGLRAWLTVAAGFCLYANTWSAQNSQITPNSNTRSGDSHQALEYSKPFTRTRFSLTNPRLQYRGLAVYNPSSASLLASSLARYSTEDISIPSPFWVVS